MKMSYTACFALLVLGNGAFADSEPHTGVEMAGGLGSANVVFSEGNEGYPYYRIPAICTAMDGTLLAFAEGRTIHHDHARNDIVLKRSTDGGDTWLPLQVVHGDSELVMVNPSPVVVGNGRILLFYETFPHGYHGRVSKGLSDLLETGFEEGRTQRFLMRSSGDSGETWSDAEDLTRITRTGEGIITSGSPANGIQLRRGEYRGRILIPLYYWKRLEEGTKTTIYNGVLYSDDGDSWSRSNVVPVRDTQAPNECLIAETDEGNVIINGRAGRAQQRAVSLSVDGGKSWNPYEYHPVFRARPCNAGLLRYSFAGEEESRLLFTWNNSTDRRANGYIACSYDNGATWPIQKQITNGFFGYSQLTRMKNGDIGVLFEPFESPNEPWNIFFVTIPLEWLESVTVTTGAAPTPNLSSP